MKFLLTLSIGLLTFQNLQSQENFWTDVANRQTQPEPSESMALVQQYRALTLDYEALKLALLAAPMEFAPDGQLRPTLSLPLPDGRMEAFQIVESPVLAPALAARYPEIKTYQGRSIDNPAITTRLDVGPLGFHAIISLPQGRMMIEPYAPQQTEYYAAYFVKDVQIPSGIQLECGFVPGQSDDQEHFTAVSNRDIQLIDLKKFTIGLACSGEYAVFHNATTKAQVLAKMTQVINFANEVMMREVAVRLEIAANTDAAIFLDPDTDPYTDGSSVADSYAQTPEILNTNIGVDNYDIGHSFIAGCGSGVVGIGGGRACNNSVGNDQFKGFGISCHISFYSTSQFAVGLVCHEVGHQLSASHTFNNCPPSAGAVTVETGYEPGSGSTIMSYAGSCGDQNIAMDSDGYYHTISLEQIRTYTQQGLGSTCAVSIPTNNSNPSVSLPYTNGFFIPIRTPFQLTGEGTDPDGEAITYCWEEFDIGPTVSIGNPFLDAPIFRSIPPASSPTRVFPSLSKIINNTSNNNEVLPTYNRNLTFRCTVRDNNPEAGGVAWSQVQFKADQTAGPFLVTAPNDNTVIWKVGDYQEVTWDVANTTNGRVKCNYVNIKLSVDGGFTYPYTLAASTPNDGSAFVSVPNAVSADARVRVEAANNIFFDISNADFSIVPATEPGFTLEVTPSSIPLYCIPGTALTVDILTDSLLGYDSTLTLSLIENLPAGVTYAFGQDQLTPGESTTLTIDFGDIMVSDTLLLQVQAEGPGLAPKLRELYLIVLSSDFSGLALESPIDGASGIIFSTDFAWTAIPNANAYDFELATSLAFGATTVDSAEGLTEVNYTPAILFDENQLYFWRVRPINDCKTGEWLPPFSFRTTAVDCGSTSANDLPINLSNNPNTKISKIIVPTDGIISDVNLKDVEVTFQPINSLRIFLVSPAGTEVRLWNLDCLNTDLIRVGFDDEAPTDIICPPTNNQPVRPDQPLSAFDGENTAGEWQLKVQVVNSGFGGGGSIKSWSLEFCAAIAGAAPPVLITNETLAVPPGQGNTITKELLEYQDDVATASQLTYTIVTPPAHGQLYRWSLSEELGVGSQFSQSTINAFNLVYVHDGSDTQTDSFTFIVEDNEGGWLPTQVFNIDIDENAVVAVKDLVAANAITLAPNPSREAVQISFRQPVSGAVSVRLLNLQGQEVLQRRFADATTPLELNTVQLPAGTYFVNVQTEQGQFTEKLVVLR